jgi:hypothetical protein
MLRSKLHFQKTIFLFSLLFLLSIVITGFHYHDDGSRHSDCPVCAAGGVSSNERILSDSGIVIRQNVSYVSSFEEVFNKFQSIFHTFASRAPPSASLV